MKVLVSACLMGRNCKYNGRNNANLDVIGYLKDKDVVCVCPEVSGGLSIPREGVEIVDGVIRDRFGNDLDSVYRKGVETVLSEIEGTDIDLAILQPRSPTCGVKFIYDGTFSRRLIPGSGIFAEALKARGYKVIEPEDLITLK